MAKIDKTKEYIGWLKVLFTLFFTIDVSLLSFLFLNYEKISLFKSIIIFVSLIIAIFITLFINSKIFQKLDELEEL